MRQVLALFVLALIASASALDCEYNDGTTKYSHLDKMQSKTDYEATVSGLVFKWNICKGAGTCNDQGVCETVQGGQVGWGKWTQNSFTTYTGAAGVTAQLMEGDACPPSNHKSVINMKCNLEVTDEKKYVVSTSVDGCTFTANMESKWACSDAAIKEYDDNNNDDLGYKILGGTIAVVFALFGLVSLFVGYRLFKLLVAAFGFIVGSVICFYVLLFIIAGSGGDLGGWVIWVVLAVAIIVGLIGAATAFYFYIVGVFLVGAMAGAFVSWLLYEFIRIFTDSAWVFWVFLVFLVLLSILCGLLAMKIQKIMIIVGSSALGGFLVYQGFLFFYSEPWYQYTVLSVCVLLAIVGIGVQMFITGKKEDKDHYDEV